MDNRSSQQIEVSTGHFPRRDITLHSETKEASCREIAQMITSPELAACRVIQEAEGSSGLGDDIDIPILLETLRAQGRAIKDGDMEPAVGMLVNQATALQSLFARLTERAMGMTKMQHFDAFLKLALRAQYQCRTTLEAISAIKSPAVVYAKQANISQGHQQVNNGVTEDSAARKSRDQLN